MSTENAIPEDDIMQHIQTSLQEAPAVDAGILRQEVYAFLDYEPQRNGWFADSCTEAFMSLSFKLYMMYWLVAATAVLVVGALDVSIAILIRIFVQPRIASDFLQAATFIVMFFYVSYVIAGVGFAAAEFGKAIWLARREDNEFMRISHGYFKFLARCGFSRCTHSAPDGPSPRTPFFVYSLILNVMVGIPFIVGLVNGATISGFVGSYSFTATMCAMSLIGVSYLWLYVLAIMEKHVAVRERKEVDENLNLGERRSWWCYPSILETYGLDVSTIRWSFVVYTVGLTPLWSLLIVTDDPSPPSDFRPSIAWLVISVVALTVLILVVFLTFSKRQFRYAPPFLIFCLAVIFIVGIVGGAATSNSLAVGFNIVLAIATQGGLTRKRAHQLSRKEVVALLNVPMDEADAAESQNRFSTTLCCCFNTCAAVFGCLDIKTLFGYRHPALREEERRWTKERLALRTDHRVVLAWWIFLWALAAMSLSTQRAAFDALGIAPASTLTGRGATVGTAAGSPLCRAGAAVGAPLGTVDLAALAALTYAEGQGYLTGFAILLGHLPQLTLVSSPPNFFADPSVEVGWDHYEYDGTQVVAIRTMPIGEAWLRNVDVWGDSAGMAAAMFLGPSIASWSYRNQLILMRFLYFTKMQLGSRNIFGGVESYVQGLKSRYGGNRTIVVGHSFAGGFARIVAARVGVAAIGFNSPSSSLMTEKYDFSANDLQRGLDIGVADSLERLVDPFNMEDFELPCASAKLPCGSIAPLFNALTSLCGDTQGRAL